MSETADPLHDSDFYAWTQEQAARLRAAAAQRVNADVDWENLAEEIESMGRSDRRELRHRLGELLLHLAKLGWSPDLYPRRKWQQSARNQRQAIAEALLESPSLAGVPAQVLAPAWEQARGMAEAVLALPENTIPRDCPWTLNGQILNADWFPEAPPTGEPRPSRRRYGVVR